MDLSRAHAVVKTPVVGELLLEVFNSIFEQLHRMQGDPDSMSVDVAQLYGKPVGDSGNIVWGMKDPILGRALPAMKRNFPGAPVTETEAGHFLQEEVPGEIAAALLRVIDQVQ